MNPPKQPSSSTEIVPASGGKPLAEVAAEKAVDHLMPNATPSQRQAVATLVAPWAEKLVRALDEIVRVPGTNIGIGLDAVVGFFVPVAGDVVTGLGSIALLVLAIKNKVPTVAIARMLINIAIDTISGSVPVVGDIFDIFWKSNRMNLDIIEKFKDNPKEKPHAGDYALVALGIVMAVASFVIPIVMTFVFGATVFSLVGTLLTWLFSGGSAAH